MDYKLLRRYHERVARPVGKLGDSQANIRVKHATVLGSTESIPDVPIAGIDTITCDGGSYTDGKATNLGPLIFIDVTRADEDRNLEANDSRVLSAVVTTKEVEGIKGNSLFHKGKEPALDTETIRPSDLVCGPARGLLQAIRDRERTRDALIVG